MCRVESLVRPAVARGHRYPTAGRCGLGTRLGINPDETPGAGEQDTRHGRGHPTPKPHCRSQRGRLARAAGLVALGAPSGPVRRAGAGPVGDRSVRRGRGRGADVAAGAPLPRPQPCAALAAAHEARAAVTTGHPPLLRHLRPRGDDLEQPITTVELFFDLVYVFAITQCSHMILANLTVAELGRASLLLLIVWWAWIYTTWMANWFDPTSPAVRGVLTGVMLASLLMAAALPGAFGEDGVVFAI